MMKLTLVLKLLIRYDNGHPELVNSVTVLSGPAGNQATSFNIK
jgi:hypothetical protein